MAGVLYAVRSLIIRRNRAIAPALLQPRAVFLPCRTGWSGEGLDPGCIIPVRNVADVHVSVPSGRSRGHRMMIMQPQAMASLPIWVAGS